jgi:PhnB protein
VFGGTLNLNTFADFGNAGADGDRIMHGQLETDLGYTIMGADNYSDAPDIVPAGFSVSISGDDGDAMRGYFEKLSADGAVTMPMAKQVWGDEFGMCTDQFGVPWLVNISGAQA